MKYKATPTLVAAAVGLCLSQATLAQCLLAGNSALPFVAGPVNPVNGFPEFVLDANNLALELCLEGDGATGPCFYDPVVPGNLFSQQIGFGAEGFWWLAEAAIPGDGATTVDALVVMAAEAAFLTEEPANGDQFPFTRLRIRLDVPLPGTYTVNHPFGAETYVVDAVGAGDEVRETFDVQFLPDAVNQGCTSPWLVSEGFPGSIAGFPGTFIGDGTPRLTTTGDAFTVTGPGGTVSTDQFTIFGKVWDSVYNTPLVGDRASYDRPTLGGQAGQVDAFATSFDTPEAAAATAVTVSGGPNLPAAELPMAGPDGLGLGGFFRSEVLADATELPSFVAITGIGDPSAITPTDPTTLLLPLTDVVTVTRAEYVLATGTLEVEAVSSDLDAIPELNLVEYDLPVPALGSAVVTTVAPPATITVTSAVGGMDTESVSVVQTASNRAPAITSTPVTTAIVGIPYSYPVTAVDPNPADTLSYALTVAPDGMTISATGLITWTPAQAQVGPNAVTVTVTDNGTPALDASQSFVVSVVNDAAPVAQDANVSTAEDVPVLVTLVATDADADPLTYQILAGPTNGTLSGTAPNLTYTPNPNYFGADSFTFVASDGLLDSNTATVSITVTPVNDRPVAVNDAFTTPAGTAITITDAQILANDTDVEDGQPTGISVFNTALLVGTGATFERIGNSITVTPSPTFVGNLRIRYRAQDSQGLQSAQVGVIVIQVTPINLTIQRLFASAQISVRATRSIALTLDVRNRSAAAVPAPGYAATLVGVQTGGEVYRETIQVAPAPATTVRYSFPSYKPLAAGVIDWTVTVVDADNQPANDVATRSTIVNP